MSSNGVHYPEEKMAFISEMQVDNEGILWAVGKARFIEGLFHLDTLTGYWIWHTPDALYLQSQQQAFRLVKETKPLAFQS